MSSVQEIKEAIAGLTPEERAELNRWLRSEHPGFNPETDSPELEAELVKTANSRFSAYSSEQMRAKAMEVIRHSQVG
jgi:hypothetical protein